MPSVLPSAVINTMRAVAKKFMTDQCTILRLARSGSATDGFREDWVPLSVVPCRLDAQSSLGATAKELNVEAATVLIEVPWDAPLTTHCRIRHGDVTYVAWEVADESTPLIIRQATLMRVDIP